MANVPATINNANNFFIFCVFIDSLKNLVAKVDPVSNFAKIRLLFSEKYIQRYTFEGEMFPDAVLQKPLVRLLNILRQVAVKGK